MPSRLFKTIQRLTLASAIAAGGVVAGAACADTVQRADLPAIQGVTIVGVKDGEILYRTAAGDRGVALKDVAFVAVDSVPKLAEGQLAFAEGQMRSAQRAFDDVWKNSRVDWARHFAGYFLVQINDGRQDPVEAAQLYSKLASEKCDVFFLSKPPVASLKDADEAQKQRISDEVLAVINETKGEQRKMLQSYLRQVSGDAATIPEIGPDPSDKAASARKNSKVILPDAVWKMLDRKKQPEGKWDAIKLLSEGKYEDAIASIQQWLKGPGDMPEKLFVLGRAQLALADEKKDDKLYRDAGLTFMRIVVHFTRQGQSHSLVAPAELEVGYIHKQIGREDIYNTLLFGGDQGGGVRLVIDNKQAYPEYRLRYYQIIGEDPPAEE